MDSMLWWEEKGYEIWMDFGKGKIQVSYLYNDETFETYIIEEETIIFSNSTVMTANVDRDAILSFRRHFIRNRNKKIDDILNGYEEYIKYKKKK